VGDGSPGSREAEGEGGDGFYIAQSGRRADLLVSPREGEGERVDVLNVSNGSVLASQSLKKVPAARSAGLGSGGKGIKNSLPRPPFSATFHRYLSGKVPGKAPVSRRLNSRYRVAASSQD